MTGQETNTRAPATQPGPRPWEDRAWVRGLSLLLRLGLAAVWLVAGALKVTDPDGMERSVRAFRILPEVFVEPVSYALPFVELALGALLLVGLAVRAGAAVSALLFAVYVAAIASAAARGLRIDCGCFSSGGDLAADEPTRYAQELTRDSLLLVASLLLARFPRGYLAVDQLLFGPSPAAPTPADWDDDGDDDPDDGRRAGDGRPGEVEQAAGGRAADERGGGDGVREGVRHRENADPRTRGKR